MPSEFGADPARMEKALEPGRVTFDDKLVVRKAVEDAEIPHTYISANCFAGYFVGGLCQPGSIMPSRDSVVLLGDANQKGIAYDYSMLGGWVRRWLGTALLIREVNAVCIVAVLSSHKK